MNFLKSFAVLIFLIFTTVTVHAQSTDKRCKSIFALKSTKPLKSKSELKSRFLKSHNEIRRKYGVPSLVWDQKLANYAQEWANKLKAQKCQMKHRTQNKYGENLAMNWTSRSLSSTQFDKSPEYVVQNWAKECKDYSHKSHSCQKGKVCGHFTQVVWEESERVGCGMVTCDGRQNAYGTGRVELWVCNYDPPGNYIGQSPF